MKSFFCIAILVCCGFQPVCAKVRIIDIKTILEKAKNIRTVIVYGYTDSTMLYGFPGSQDTLSIVSKLRTLSENFRRDLIHAHAMAESDLAGKWPAAGDTVLMVQWERQWVEVFAVKISGKYRFWDPNNIPFANSVFSFREEAPFHALPQCEHKDRDGWCPDGCLVDCAAIKERY